MFCTFFLARSVRFRTPCWNLCILPPALGSSPLLFVILYFSRRVSSLHHNVSESAPESQASLVFENTPRARERDKGYISGGEVSELGTRRNGATRTISAGITTEAQCLGCAYPPGHVWEMCINAEYMNRNLCSTFKKSVFPPPRRLQKGWWELGWLHTPTPTLFPRT